MTSVKQTIDDETKIRQLESDKITLGLEKLLLEKERDEYKEWYDKLAQSIKHEYGAIIGKSGYQYMEVVLKQLVAKIK